MAVNNAGAEAMDVTAGRRIAIGLNVTLTVLLAAALVVVANWLGSVRHFRADAASFGGQGLSERTRTVLTGLNTDVNITTAYLSEETGKSRDKYLGRLMSYCDDLRLASSRVQVTHIAKEDDKVKLVERLRTTYGGESEQHQKAIADFTELKKSQLDTVLQFGSTIDAQGQGAERWITYFPVFINVLNLFEDDAKSIKNASEEIQRLTTSGIPKFGEATGKISSALRPIKDHLTAAQKKLGDIALLADAVRKPDSTIVKTVNEVTAGIPAVIAPLKAAVGAGGAAAPADSKSALEAFAAEAQKGEDALRQLAGRLSRLGKENPSLASHQYWQLSQSMGSLPIQMAASAADILQDLAASLKSFRQQVLDVKDRGDEGAMAGAVGKLRTAAVPNVEHNLDVVADSLKRLVESLSNVDPESARLLEACKGGQAFAAAIKGIDDLLGKVDKLPELKLGKIADEVKNDNIVVIEANKQAKVLTYDDVWPLREQINQGVGAATEDRPRSFNGDNAIGGAVLSLTSEKPFATVVLASFETEPPPQARQFMQPQESSIPVKSLNTLKDRLKGANFVVHEWDLSKPGDPPAPEKDTENLFIFLPPAPPNQPNPFSGGPPPQKEFGDAERKRVQDVLDKGGRALFLAGWEVKSAGFFGGFTSPEYGYNRLLRDSYGINVLTNTRVVEVEPVANEPNIFMLSPEKFQYMGLNDFTDQPIGRPFKLARLLVMDACPVLKTEKTPDGVTLEPVLNVPASERYVAADLNEVIRMVNIVQNSETGGRIDRKPSAVTPPYPVVMAATTKKGDKETRLVVFGIGKDMDDRFLSRPKFTIVNGRMLTDPPPSNNADLLINGLHWVRGQEQWIAAGPATAPAIAAIPPDTMRLVQGFLWVVLPVLVFVPGAMAWWARRQ